MGAGRVGRISTPRPGRSAPREPLRGGAWPPSPAAGPKAGDTDSEASQPVAAPPPRPDLSQDERQSRRPEPQAAGDSGQGERRDAPVPARRALALGLGWPRWGSTEAQTEGPRCPGVVLDSHPGNPPLPLRRRPWGPRGSLAAPVLVLQETLGATWEEAVAWKLWEAALGGHKGDIHSQDWQAGSGGSGRDAGPPGCFPFPGGFPPFLAGAQTGGKSSRTVPLGLLE